MALFGLAISVGVAALLLFLGILLLVSKKAKAWFRAVPLISKLPMILVAGVLILVGFTAGGIGWYQTQWSGLTASVQGIPAGTQAGVTQANLNCKFVDNIVGAGLMAGNVTSTIDTSNNQHITATIKNATLTGAMFMQANLTCVRTGDVDKAVAFNCYAIADTYRNEMSTTDTNSYRIVSTSTSASSVSGVPWQQAIYFGDNTGATTSSDKETLAYPFASGTAQKKLGVGFTLAGDTAFNYLSGTGATPSVKVYCNNALVGTITISKQLGVA